MWRFENWKLIYLKYDNLEVKILVNACFDTGSWRGGSLIRRFTEIWLDWHVKRRTLKSRGFVWLRHRCYLEWVRLQCYTVVSFLFLYNYYQNWLFIFWGKFVMTNTNNLPVNLNWMALPTKGRVIINTTAGEIDIELWSKVCLTRNMGSMSYIHPREYRKHQEHVAISSLWLWRVCEFLSNLLVYFIKEIFTRLLWWCHLSSVCMLD